MKKNPNWKINASLLMVSLSAFFYYFHYLVFKDAHHIFIYLIGDIAFVFLEVLLVSIIIHRVLNEWEKKSNMRKLNMVIEVFFSEFGKHLLGYLSAYDQNLNKIKSRITCDDGGCDIDFKSAFRFIKIYKADLDINAVDLKKLAEFLKAKRGFLVDLLQNPTLLAHENFTETLMAVFHITEELSERQLDNLSEKDEKHTKYDIERGYNGLMQQWLSYMYYTKLHYPYFFVFAMRTNPFSNQKNYLNY